MTSEPAGIAGDAVSCQQTADDLAKARERLGPGWVSELLAEAENAILSLEDRVKELEGMLAEVEETRRWRLARQREGIAAAQDRGVSFGRPRKPVPENFEDVKALYQEGRISSREAAKMVGICQDTFLRWCRGR